MNICFLMISDFDFEVRAGLYSDLALELKERGHNVFVVVPSDRADVAPFRLSQERGVQVLRVYCRNLFNVGFVAKGVANLRLPGRVARAMARALAGIHFDLVLFHTPPIFYAGLVEKLKRRHECPAYLILRDIFPQNAVDLGVLRNRWMVAWFRRVERRLYACSDRIGCMSPGNIRYLREHAGVEAAKLELLPNWTRIRSGPAALDRGRALLEEWGLGGKYVAIFGGVLGVSQGLDFILDFSKTTGDLPDVRFLIIGEGNRRAHLEKRVRNEGIGNVQVRTMIDRVRFASLVANCQVGLVSLARAFTIPNIPSKVLAYFEAGIPVLAATDPHTDFGDILRDAGAGFWALSGDLNGFRAQFMKLYRDTELRVALGRSGRRYLEANLTVEKAADTILAGEVAELARSGSRGERRGAGAPSNRA